MMKPVKRVIWRMGSFLLGAVVAVSGCSPAEGNADEVESGVVQGTPPLTRSVNVEVESVAPTPFTDYIRITGQAEAFYDITLSAEEPGTITTFEVEKGQRVRVGQVIARTDAAVLDAQVAEARASAALADEQFERQRRLWEDEGIGSEISFLEAKYRAEIAKAQVRTLETRLDRMEIRSPVDGVFDEKFVEAGEIAMIGSPVVRVVSLDRIKVTGGVPERFAASVSRGDAAVIAFDILPGREFHGSISFVGNSVNEQNRTFPIEIVMRNPDGVVKPRMVANVRLVRDALMDVVVVPQQVVQRSESGYHVFVAVERSGETYAEARPVRLGSAYGSEVVIEDGLETGESLITLGSQLVDDGSRIRVVNADAATGSTEGASNE